MTLKKRLNDNIISFFNALRKNRLGKIATASAKTQALIMIAVSFTIMIFASVTFDHIVVNYAESLEREHLLAKTRTAMSILDPKLISTLQGSHADIGKLNYQKIRNQLILIKKANPDTHFVYLMSKNGEDIIFLADAEPVDSEDYSAPGDVYDEASDELNAIFTNGTAFTEGPMEDRWGIWVSAIVGIPPKAEKPIAVLGIDVDAKKWRQTINVYRWFNLIIAMLLQLIILSFIWVFYQISSKNNKIRIANQELQRNKDFYESFMKNLPAYAFMKRASGEYIYVNKPVDFVANSSPEIRLGKTDNEVFPSDIAARLKKNDELVLTSNKNTDLIEDTPDTTGKNRTNLVYKFPVKLDPETTFIGGIAIDITRQLEAERARDNLKVLLANITDSMPSALILIDREMEILHWNREAEKTFSITQHQAMNKPLDQILPDHQTLINFVKKALKKNEPSVLPNRIRYINRETVYEDIAAFPLLGSNLKGMVVRIDDVTHKVKTQRMLIQSEKMLSVGGLAAGMAHEINNPLSGMMQSAQVIHNRLSKKIPANIKAAQKVGTTFSAVQSYMKLRNILPLLETLHGAGKRAAEIVENMLGFAKQGKVRKSGESMAHLLDKTIVLASSDYSLKKNYDFKQILICREYEEPLPEVFCKAASIQQVFYNIIKNGAEAMFTQRHRQPPQFTFRLSQEKANVRIEIEDNGPGMKEKIRERIFEPFFTTKGVEKGTGLGLSISYYIIVDEHRGEMAVESIPEKGTKFIIKLPAGNFENA